MTFHEVINCYYICSLESSVLLPTLYVLWSAIRIFNSLFTTKNRMDQLDPCLYIYIVHANWHSGTSFVMRDSHPQGSHYEYRTRNPSFRHFLTIFLLLIFSLFSILMISSSSNFRRILEVISLIISHFCVRHIFSLFF